MTKKDGNVTSCFLNNYLKNRNVWRCHVNVFTPYRHF